MTVIDLFALGIVAAAMLRGAWIGLLREALSLTALAAAVFAVRVWDRPFASWLQNPNGLGLSYYVAPWLAGVILFAGVLIGVAAFGRGMRQGERNRTLGLADRVGGGLLGIGEGALAVGALIFVLAGAIGRGEQSLARSSSMALVSRVTGQAAAQSTPVALVGSAGTASSSPGASGFLVVALTLGGLGLLTWNRWTSEVVVRSPRNLPKGVWPAYVHWVPANHPGDRVLVGPLQRQEWHLIDRAKTTHLVLAWKERD